MGKGIIVIEDIPVICEECERAEVWSNKLYCLEEDRIIHNSKPDWCPIKEIPKKKEIKDAVNMTSLGWIEGFNACLDEIEGKM